MKHLINCITFFLIISLLASCKSKYEQDEEKRYQERKAERKRNDSLAILENIYKASPTYEKDEKKRLQLIKKAYDVINSCYEKTTFGYGRKKMSETTFNMTKFQKIMEGKGFAKGEHLGDYFGQVDGFLLRIEMHQATPSSSGWVQNFGVTCNKIEAN